MEKELNMDNGCVLDYSTFYNYWLIFKKNYNDKTHTDEDSKYYYACFKEVPKDLFLQACKKTLQESRYFPNINEWFSNIPTIDLKDKMESWDFIEKEEMSKEELKELEDMFKEYK